MSNKRDLEFVIDLGEVQGVIFDVPYYSLVRDCLSKYGDDVETGNYGFNRRDKPRTYLNTDSNLLSFLNYSAPSVSVMSQIYSGGGEEEIKGFLNVRVRSRSLRCLETFVEDFKEAFEKKFGKK